MEQILHQMHTTLLVPCSNPYKGWNGTVVCLGVVPSVRERELKMNGQERLEKITNAIWQYIVDHPNSSRSQIYEAVPGNNILRNMALLELLRSGRFEKFTSYRVARDGKHRKISLWKAIEQGKG